MGLRSEISELVRKLWNADGTCGSKCVGIYLGIIMIQISKCGPNAFTIHTRHQLWRLEVVETVWRQSYTNMHSLCLNDQTPRTWTRSSDLEFGFGAGPRSLDSQLGSGTGIPNRHPSVSGMLNSKGELGDGTRILALAETRKLDTEAVASFNWAEAGVQSLFLPASHQQLQLQNS